MNKLFGDAKWIWFEEPSVNQYVDFRCEFNLAKANDISLHISADTKYAVYVNGNYIPAFQYGDYPFYKVYDTIDISSHTVVGQNILTIVGYYQYDNSHSYKRGEAGLIFAVRDNNGIVAYSDRNTICRPSIDYKSGKIERINEQLSYTFRYDMNGYDGFKKSDYVPDCSWNNSRETGFKCQLFPRPIEPLLFEKRINSYVISQGVFIDAIPENSQCGDLMQNAFLSFRSHSSIGLPSSITPLPNSGVSITKNDKNADGVYLIIDLGREECGVFDLDIEFERSTKILVGYGEHLEDMRVRTSVGGRQFAAVFCGKCGRNRFMHLFKRFGCRYISLHIYSDKFKLYYAGLRPTPYPFKYKAVQRPNDALNKKIFDTCVRTLELCVHEHYEDCPWREQALYAMDSQNQMLFGYNLFDNPELPRESLRLLAFGQRENGVLEICAPSSYSLTIPSFSLCFVSAYKEYFERTNDRDFAYELLPCVERIFDYFFTRCDDCGLVKHIKEEGVWNFYEWSAGMSGGELSDDGSVEKLFDAPLNALLLIAINDLIFVLNKLNLTEKHLYYISRAKKLKSALNAFYDKKRDLYASYITNEGLANYSEFTQCLMICANAVTDERSLLKKVTSENNGLVHTTLSCTLYKYMALMRYPELYGDWVKSDVERIWGKMLYNGATSFWETAEGPSAFDRAGSLCHGWSAVPIYYYTLE